LLVYTISVIAQNSVFQELALFTTTTSTSQEITTTPTQVTFDSIINITEGVNIEIPLIKETSYYHNGSKRFVRYYQENTPFGTWSYFSPNGQLKHSINNFKKYYVVNTYFTNNNIQKTRKYKNKQKNVISPCKEEQYYPNGSMFGYGNMAPKKVINHTEMLEEGKWQFFHPNGLIESKGKFVSGKKDGLWIYYNKKGTKREVVRFKNGNIISQKTINNPLLKQSNNSSL